MPERITEKSSTIITELLFWHDQRSKHEFDVFMSSFDVETCSQRSWSHLTWVNHMQSGYEPLFAFERQLVIYFFLLQIVDKLTRGRCMLSTCTLQQMMYWVSILGLWVMAKVGTALLVSSFNPWLICRDRDMILLLFCFFFIDACQFNDCIILVCGTCFLQTSFIIYFVSFYASSFCCGFE